jgi:hypothetical protein
MMAVDYVAINAIVFGFMPSCRPSPFATSPMLAEMSRKIGLTNADVEVLEQTRDTKPAEPLRFE